MLGRSGNLRQQLLLAVAFGLLLNEKNVYGLPCTIKSNPSNPAQGIHANQPITLECDASGTYVDRFSWSRDNGRPIKGNVSTTNTSSTLSLKVKNKLNGKFICTVVTGRRNESCFYTLRVNVFAAPVVSPKVITPSRRVFSYEGDNVTLVCEEWALCREGRTVDSITWFYDGKELTKDRVIMYKVEDECDDTGRNIVRLRRTNLTFQDQGEYSCKFVGEDGEATETIELVIFRKGFLDVTPKLPLITVQPGSNVTVECETTYPDAETLGEFWLMNGVLLHQTSDDRYSTKKSEVVEQQNPTENTDEDESKLHRTKVKFSLTVRNVTRADLGSYECGVNTTLGMRNASFQLHVREVPITRTPVTDGLPKSNFVRYALGTVGAILGLIVLAVVVKYYRQFNRRGRMKELECKRY